jgi:hypothetical protein
VLPSYIIAEDFNQDSWLDLAVACEGSSQVFRYNNARLGGLFAVPWNYNVGGGPVALVSGQMDIPNGLFDGRPDIAVLSTLNLPGTNGIPSPCGAGWIAANQAPGPWNGAIPGVVPPAVGLVHFAGDDFNADGRIDFAFASQSPNALTVFNSVLGGYVAAPPLPLACAPVFVVTGDFDRNGRPDIAVAGTVPGGIEVSYNGAPVVAVAGLFPLLVLTGMDVGDFNADGYPDLVVVGNVPNGNGTLSGWAQVFLNSVPITGAVGFVAPPNLIMKTWGFDAQFVEVLAADGNGRDDFAVANRGSDTITIFLTDATGFVQDNRPVDPSGEYCLCKEQRKIDLLNIKFKLFKIKLQCGHFPIGLAAGDFDRNGKMDLAVALESKDEHLCAQNPSCIEIDFDIACGFNSNQTTHNQIRSPQESQTCPDCKEEPCGGNTPPKPAIDTEGSDSKN